MAIIVPPYRYRLYGRIFLKRKGTILQKIGPKGVLLVKLYLDVVMNRHNVSVRALAKKSGVAKSHIEKIMTGETNPTIEVMCKLARALGEPIESLFSCDDE